MGKRFGEVRREHDEVYAEERSSVEARNIAALVKWGGKGAGGLGLEEKVQMLDQVLDGVWSLSEPGGRYGRVVEGFEVWADRVAEIIAMRRSGNADDLVKDDEVLFVGDLDTRWKDDCAGLVRKLDAWSKILREIGPAPAEDGAGQEKSSLSRALDGCRNLVHDMLAEMELMQDTEKESRNMEDEWIEEMNEQLKIGDHEAMSKEPPLWKMIT